MKLPAINPKRSSLKATYNQSFLNIIPLPASKLHQLRLLWKASFAHSCYIFDVFARLSRGGINFTTAEASRGFFTSVFLGLYQTRWLRREEASWNVIQISEVKSESSALEIFLLCACFWEKVRSRLIADGAALMWKQHVFRPSVWSQNKSKSAAQM